MTEGSSPFVRLDHVGYVVTDLAAASAFFVDVLGFEALARKGVIEDPVGSKMPEQFGTHPGSACDFAFFKLGDFLVELLAWTSPDHNPTPAKNSDAAGRHLSLFVTDLESVRQAIGSRPGIKIREKTERGFVYVETPFGLEIQMVPLS